MKFTRRRTRNFTVVPNELLDDSRLSLEAKAVQARLLKLPDSWQVNLRELGRWAQCGRDKMRRIVRELIETGWVEREQTRDPNTQTIGYLYIVRDEPSKGAASDKKWFPKNGTINDSVGNDRPQSKSPPSPDVPATEDPSTADLSPEESNIDNNKSPPDPPTGGIAEISFRDFWERWPAADGESQVATRRAWIKCEPSERSAAIQYIDGFVKQTKHGQRRLCWARTYLRDKRWRELANRAVSAKDVCSVAVGSEQYLAWLEYWEAHDPRKAALARRCADKSWTIPHEWPPSL